MANNKKKKIQFSILGIILSIILLLMSIFLLISINILGIILSGVALYYIGNLLSDTLKILCINLNVPEFVIGVLLGIITSIPELITFFESQKHHNKKENHEGIVEATSNLLFSNFINLFIIQSLGIIIFLIV